VANRRGTGVDMEAAVLAVVDRITGRKIWHVSGGNAITNNLYG
jgi:hypothetical protein